MLNEHATREGFTSSNERKASPLDKGRKNDMSPWLKEQLEKADVLNIIEPFWSSLYKQVGSVTFLRLPFLSIL